MNFKFNKNIIIANYYNNVIFIKIKMKENIIQ